MNVLLLTIGSAGDVHPFIGLGLALRERGHRVKIITNPYYADAVSSSGLELVPLGTAEFFANSLADPELWHKRKGTALVFNLVSSGLRETYDAVVNHHVPGETVLVSSSLGLAGRIAQDKLNIPTVTVHLSPAQFRSCLAPPILPGLWMPAWLPMWLKQRIWAGGDKFVIDPMLAPRINALRAELGLPAVEGILRDFWNSPQRVIGLFPDWFGHPQKDWPAQTRLTGFPRYDEAGMAGLDPALDEFLNAGSPPIVFTPGSAMYHAEQIFAASLEACNRLNCRGIFVTRHAAQIPANLPATVRHFSYAPFSQLFPRSAAVVHHGGIGTSAQAMATGTRQLITPFAHDQFDNADRLQKLGVGRVVPAKNYNAKTATRELGLLLADESVGRNVAEVARRFQGDESVRATCEWIEALATTTEPGRVGPVA